MAQNGEKCKNSQKLSKKAKGSELPKLAFKGLKFENVSEISDNKSCVKIYSIHDVFKQR